MNLKDRLNYLVKEKILFLMILPAVIYFLIMNYAPMLGIVLSFKRYNFTQGIWGSPWVGLENFRFLYISGDLWRITRNTVLYNLTFLVFTQTMQMVIAIIFSELLSKWFKKISQSIIFLPHFMSYVVISTFVYNVLNYEYGSLNTILKSLNMQPVDVYNNTALWPYIIVGFHTWKALGYGMIIFLASIMGISEEYYEAAVIDGANVLQQIRYITIPMLIPTLVILTLLNIGRIFRGQFELFYQIIGNNSVLFNTTDIIDTYVFRALTDNFVDIGMGVAVGFYQSLFGLILILIVNKLVHRYQPDYALF